MLGHWRSTKSANIRWVSWVMSFLLGLLLSVAAGGMADAQQPVYKFAVFPYLSPEQLETIYDPIAADLSRASASDIRFSTSTTFPIFAKNLRQQAYDIAFIQPFYYTTIAAEAGYVPLARVAGDLAGLIVVPQDSPVQNLQDLQGKTLALPPVKAAVSHLAKIALSQAGLDPERDVTLNHVPSHSACLQQLVVKKAQACASGPTGWHIFQKRRPGYARLLMKTSTIPNSLVVVHNRVPEHHRALLQQTMISWHQSDRGRQLLQRAQFSKFVPALDADYDIVRQYWKEILQTCSRDCP